MIYVFAIVGGTVLIGLVIAGLISFIKSWKGDKNE